ncbi:hypothetical protein CVP04_06805 [Caviibacterium pharyngocola]|uniref:C-type lysozyme inhibitor domain-containing protein n=2 Tax=Caviibacterium pharyngocola TaxID=28159 RepID=A0A2M8RW96_9PAST|nr:hypothetical protein CVP04_06805 [Caviibacterium pharyngocola]
MLSPVSKPTTVKNSPAIEKSTQQGKAIRYLCKDDKEVRVVRSMKSKKRKLNTVNITFEQNTQKLTQAISESGQKYTNIHWHWIERNEFATLTNAVGDILAEQCVAQKP